MPINDKNDITLGIGVVELGNYNGDTFLGYSDVGAVKTKVEIVHEREILDFEAGRPLVVILQEVIREKVTVRFSFAELNLAVVKQTLGQANLSSGSVPVFLDGASTAPRGTLEPGLTNVVSGELMKFGGTPTHAFVGLRFTHQKRDGKRVVFEGYKASPMGNLTMPFQETDWMMMEAEFRLLADTTKPAGEQYYQLLHEQ